ncbi:hypothetical protein C0075_12565 [Rhizobium sp. KAs_5_22]|nr:hypothetical protein C0075_12565 [Rhizobium sp. KAs_5_22]
MACRPSPPQGGRSACGIRNDGGWTSRVCRLLERSLDDGTFGEGCHLPISPLEGEMPGRAEGGTRDAPGQQ